MEVTNKQYYEYHTTELAVAFRTTITLSELVVSVKSILYDSSDLRDLRVLVESFNKCMINS